MLNSHLLLLRWLFVILQYHDLPYVTVFINKVLVTFNNCMSPYIRVALFATIHCIQRACICGV